MSQISEQKTLILTGASRGIGHATVKRFSSAGWRVITCSRQAFSEDCPWDAGPEDHIQIDLADPEDRDRGIAEMRDRLEGAPLNALAYDNALSRSVCTRVPSRSNRKALMSYMAIIRRRR